ncbi:MAG: hypothetical protein OXL41_04495 [Nitrospinae bacterium]|nr:hypothetical protein [Nitrospinota bacterium]
MFSLTLKALLLSLALTGGVAAEPVSECNTAMIGEWICGRTRYLKISHAVGGDGLTRVTFVDGWLSGEGRETHTEIVDGKVHILRNGLRYAASCNHRIGTRKIYRRAARDEATGRVLIGDYIVLEDGRMLIGLFGNGKMEGYDVKNSSRPSEPDRIVECIRCQKTGC